MDFAEAEPTIDKADVNPYVSSVTSNVGRPAQSIPAWARDMDVECEKLRKRKPCGQSDLAYKSEMASSEPPRH